MLWPEEFTLLRTFITNISVEANPDFNVDEEYLSSFGTFSDCLKKADGTYVVRFTIGNTEEYDIGEGDNTNVPYTFCVEGFAVLRLINEVEADEQECHEAALAYGIQALYGAYREQLTLISHRGPWGSNYINLDFFNVKAEVGFFRQRQDDGEIE